MKERISQSHKEKQVQMERKRKAAMFLNLIKTNQPSGPMPTIITDDSAPLYVGKYLVNLSHTRSWEWWPSVKGFSSWNPTEKWNFKFWDSYLEASESN